MLYFTFINVTLCYKTDHVKTFKTDLVIHDEFVLGKVLNFCILINSFINYRILILLDEDYIEHFCKEDTIYIKSQ